MNIGFTLGTILEMREVPMGSPWALLPRKNKIKNIHFFSKALDVFQDDQG
jgi:hypothetical protein